MKKIKKLLEKLSSGKGFYITAAVSFVLIIAAIAFVYNSSVDMLENLHLPKTTVTQTPGGEQAQKNQQGESDPRLTEKNPTEESTKKQPETTAEEKITSTTRHTPSTSAKAAVTQTTTQAQSSSQATLNQNKSFDYPVAGEILRDYSESPTYDETMEDWRVHGGIDFLAPKGSDVVSVGNGTVTKVTSEPNWGYCIEVDYGSFTGRYCGIEQGTAVGIDDKVEKGQLIGKLGEIPCESKQESHLHFEALVKGEKTDPLRALGK